VKRAVLPGRGPTGRTARSTIGRLRRAQKSSNQLRTAYAEGRYNAAGEDIGPDLGIRSCDALLFYRVFDRVLTQIQRWAERQR
jgi:hypothetical protein